MLFRSLNSSVVTVIKALANANGEMNLTIDTVEEIESETFTGINGLKSVVVGDSVTIVGRAAFYSCENLETVILSKNLIEIVNGAFEDCVNLRQIDIPNKVTEIGSYAFAGCCYLTSINIPGSVYRLGANVFVGTSLTSAIFENTAGWYITYEYDDDTDATPLNWEDLSNASTAATYLLSTYSGDNKYWRYSE